MESTTDIGSVRSKSEAESKTEGSPLSDLMDQKSQAHQLSYSDLPRELRLEVCSHMASLKYPPIIAKQLRIYWPDFVVPLSALQTSRMLNNDANTSIRTQKHRYPPTSLCTVLDVARVFSVLHVISIARQWDLEYLKKNKLKATSQETAPWAINVPCKYLARVMKSTSDFSHLDGSDVQGNFRRYIEKTVVRLRQRDTLELRVLVDDAYNFNSCYDWLIVSARGKFPLGIKHFITILRRQGEKYGVFMPSFERVLKHLKNVRWDTVSDEEMVLLRDLEG